MDSNRIYLIKNFRGKYISKLCNFCVATKKIIVKAYNFEKFVYKIKGKYYLDGHLVFKSFNILNIEQVKEKFLEYWAEIKQIQKAILDINDIKMFEKECWNNIKEIYYINKLNKKRYVLKDYKNIFKGNDV
ncbi:hypothetical protein ACXYRQ_01290 [Mycoplasma sp. 394]